MNVWATLNVSREIYNSATQDDRTHTGNKTSTRRDTHRPPPQPPHSIRHLPITSSYKTQPDNSWCSWIAGKCSATFLHYLLGLILRPVLGINIQLYFLESHISVFSLPNTSVSSGQEAHLFSGHFSLSDPYLMTLTEVRCAVEWVSRLM